jgi:hypothetical protein
MVTASEYRHMPVPPQNSVDRTIVDVSTLGVNLTYPHASVALRPFRDRPIEPPAAARTRSAEPGPPSQRWRGEGGDQESKRELAYRLVLCWNLAEGWPTEALEKRILRSVEDTLVELLELLEVRSGDVPDDIRTLGDRLSQLLAERDTHYDLAEVRPHDCAVCLAKPAHPSG